MKTTLVELCAGSAATSRRWLSGRPAALLPYNGTKTNLADRLLDRAGLRVGGCGPGDRIVLVEAGPWGEAWQRWGTFGGRVSTCWLLKERAKEKPRAVWERLRTKPVPTDPDLRVAAWAALQRMSFGSMPVFEVEGRWRWAQRPGRKTPYTLVGPRMEVDGINLGELAARIERLPWFHRVEVVRRDVRDVDPLRPAAGERIVVLFDPPYHGTTSYGCTLTRAEVLKIAEAWREAGCEVIVCEGEPLPLPGWHAERLAEREWVTCSERRVGELALFEVG